MNSPGIGGDDHLRATSKGMPEDMGNQVSYSHADNAGNQVIHPRGGKECCERGSHIIFGGVGNQALRLDREWTGHQGTHRLLGRNGIQAVMCAFGSFSIGQDVLLSSESVTLIEKRICHPG